MSTEINHSGPMASDDKRTEFGYKPVAVCRDNAQEILPRVNTARIPTLNKLPSEINMTRNRNSGKSLEDTKYLTIQRFAHGKIIDIGSEIHRLTVQAAMKKTEEAIEEAENKVWLYAEEIRIKAIQELRDKLNAEHEEVLKRIQKEQKKALKEEGLRVENTLRQMSLEQVQQEREEGEQRMKKAVAEVEQRCHQKMVKALEEARTDEREKAEIELEELDRSWQTKYQDIVEEMAEDKRKALTRLSEKKDWEKQRSVLQTRQVERESASNELKRVTNNYESRIKVLNYKLHEKENELRDLREEKVISDYNFYKVGKELFLIRDSFRAYIHQVCHCLPGQADYQMPKSKFKPEDFGVKLNDSLA